MQENIKSPQSSKFDYIFILKVLAIVFVTNSHFKSIYSDNLSRFAFGGGQWDVEFSFGFRVIP